jgi:flagellar basal-body rod protein FlgF
MDHVIYTAMSGANAAAQKQSVLSNNLANASTNGFRAELSTYRAVPIRGDGNPTRVLALEATAGYLNTPGASQRTGRNLDVMASGNVWLAVQSLDGTESYTRSGALEVSPDGTLLSGSGLPILSDAGGPIIVPQGADVSIGADGNLSAILGNQPPTLVGRLKLVSPSAEDPLKRGSDGLFRSTSGGPLPTDPAARVATGSLESSNVNAIEAMVSMIQVARQFEANMKLIQTAESNDRSAGKLLGLQG